MIDRKIAQTQIDRLAGLDWFPKDNPAAIKDLRQALEASATDVIAMAVVSDWVESNREAPKPADLRRLIWAENEKRESDQFRRTKSCPICDGTGQEIIVRGDFTGARTCKCRLVAAG